LPQACIVLGALAPFPVGVRAAEELLIGRPICEETALAAAEETPVGGETAQQERLQGPNSKGTAKTGNYGFNELVFHEAALDHQ
jgi:hypothetical protein